MRSPAVRQLQYLGEVFRETLATVRPGSLVVVGCATGNGFEHIPPETARVVGVDLNPDYLELARRRHSARLAGLELLATDLLRAGARVGRVDLVHCALVLEYVDPVAAITEMSAWLAPGGVLSLVLQLPSPEHAAITPTPFDSIKALSPLMRLVAPGVVAGAASACGLAPLMTRVDTLPSGKQFHVARYRR
ncbi:MAG: class I SAM-dependent methyltransferase [Candidatus Riflebacteria bacterium]|nr:class I SAM-dependent methyltransferase [Candidatus Riflebacteria bacterium]